MTHIPSDNPVVVFKKEFDSIKEYLTNNSEITYLSDLNKYFRKVLILSSGSYFEEQIKKLLSKYLEKISNGDIRIVNFLQKQALEGKYHQLFDWGRQDKPEDVGKNANRFLGLFGDSFKTIVNNDLKRNNELDESIKAFLEIGHLRNILVHSNFANYNYEQKDTEEIFLLFVKAMYFINYLQIQFIPKKNSKEDYTTFHPHQI